MKQDNRFESMNDYLRSLGYGLEQLDEMSAETYRHLEHKYHREKHEWLQQQKEDQRMHEMKLRELQQKTQLQMKKMELDADKYANPIAKIMGKNSSVPKKVLIPKQPKVPIYTGTAGVMTGSDLDLDKDWPYSAQSKNTREDPSYYKRTRKIKMFE